MVTVLAETMKRFVFNKVFFEENICISVPGNLFEIICKIYHYFDFQILFESHLSNLKLFYCPAFFHTD